MTDAATLAEVSERFGLGEALDAWSDELAASAEFSATAALPDRVFIGRVGDQLGLADDVTASLADATAILDDAAVRRVVAHAQWKVAERYDPTDPLPIWPDLGGAPEPGARLLWALAAISLVPRAQTLHAAAGVPDDVSIATLGDLGAQMEVHEEVHGHVGFEEMGFYAHSLTGHMFKLGRLQFQLRPWLFEPAGGLARLAPVLDVHIPEAEGPLTPERCDESFARAKPFFDSHVPGHGAEHFACLSWLLDPQLTEILAEGTNILGFQRRFKSLDVKMPIPSFIFRFVFHDVGGERDDGTVPDGLLDALPADTRLRRGIIDHVRAGGRFWMTPGWATIQ